MREIIQDYMYEDIMNNIHSLGFTIANLDLIDCIAVTDMYSQTVFLNSSSITLFVLAEEYIHARQHHHRRCDGYDVRNPDEIEAHHLAIDYLIASGEKYDCPRDWQQFMIATGTPAHLRDYVIEQYNNSPDGVLFKSAL